MLAVWPASPVGALPMQGNAGQKMGNDSDMTTIQNLMRHHTEISRNVTVTPNGIQAHTGSSNPQVWA